ncbi:37S ribosomal protein S10 [Penicillium subrubescens]|uniref:37S ribosomal protein S10 n=1 Tax=Penicillium subrubescens TaxID=1316194 RepID=UPI002544F82B|nr:37S ribosomal protein S10 [Penicillium subrubescens]KAJ5873588.1 37S ribosomal protein S10 [Penicillium subrubescens]
MFPSTTPLDWASKRLRCLLLSATINPEPAHAPSTEQATTPSQTKPRADSPHLSRKAANTFPAAAEQPAELPVRTVRAFGEHARLPQRPSTLPASPPEEGGARPPCMRKSSTAILQRAEPGVLRRLPSVPPTNTNLPVSGPVPLPRITEHWTVTRSNFVHKKSKENFERITLRGLIQIKDGNPQAVQAWLAFFLRKHAFHGVGMKANVWENESLDAAKALDASLPEIQKTVGPHLTGFGQRQDNSVKETIFGFSGQRAIR